MNAGKTVPIYEDEVEKKVAKASINPLKNRIGMIHQINSLKAWAEKLVISDEAIESSVEVELPKLKFGFKAMQTEPTWIVAFAWFNRYVNDKPYDLSMGCQPCFYKVLYALDTAKRAKPDTKAETVTNQ